MIRRLLSIFAVLALTATAAFAQTAVQQSAQDLRAATTVGTSKTSAATITVAAVNGQYFYLTGIDITNCAGASAVSAATPTDISTTNLNGAVWTVGSGATAGLCQTQSLANAFGPAGLKSATAGVATTIVLPTFATNQVIRVSVYGYYGS